MPPTIVFTTPKWYQSFSRQSLVWHLLVGGGDHHPHSITLALYLYSVTSSFASATEQTLGSDKVDVF